MLTMANHKGKNLGSIKDIKGEQLINEFDLLTYSFPCQDISQAGQRAGITETSRSGLLWEVERLLSELKLKPNFKLPKFLLMENVPALINVKNIDDYNKWTETLEEKLNYKTFTIKLNSFDFGTPQSRQRVFALSINKDTKHLIKLLAKLVNQNPKLSIEKNLENFLINNYGSKSPLNPYLRVTDDVDSDLYQESQKAQLKATKSRIKIIEKSKVLNNSLYCNTITTKQDRFPNAGLIKLDKNIRENLNYTNYRYITPREAMLLMGFNDKDYDTLKNSDLISDSLVYKMAGNAIVINVLEALFKFIYYLEALNIDEENL